MTRLFISHAHADQKVAKLLAKWLEACDSDLTSFLSSRPGDIRASAEWLSSIQKALHKADAYLILLTPNSVIRPWVSFETGVAWFSEKPFVLVRAGGLKTEEIPLPMSKKQLYCLESIDDVRAIFCEFSNTQPTQLEEFVTEVASLCRRVKLTGEEEPAWEGVACQGTFYAWAGPLLGLDDKPETQCSNQLIKILKQRGMSVRLGNQDRLSHHFSKGRSQVFATDKVNWRRPVVLNKQLLLVARPEDTKP